MEIIVVSGCSFTDKNFKSDVHLNLDTSYKKWPELIKFKGNVINVGRSGADNITIINNVFDEMYKNPHIDRIVIALSSWFRFSTPDRDFHPITYKRYTQDPTIREKFKFKPRIYDFMDYHKKYYDIFDGLNDNNLKHLCEISIDNTLRHLWLLYNICKIKNIKLHIFQMLSSTQLTNKSFDNLILLHEKFCRYLIGHPLFTDIENLKDVDLIGWPFESDIGGDFCDNYLNEEHRISKFDSHPNAKGHRAIAHWFDIHAKDI